MNVSQNDENWSTVETFWIGIVGTLHMTIGFGTDVENFAMSYVLFDSIAFVFLDSQKKDNSDDWFDNGDNGNEVTFDGEIFSFVSLVSGFQKNESSVTDFVCGNTGDETNFVGGTIHRDATCCIGVFCEGTDI